MIVSNTKTGPLICLLGASFDTCNMGVSALAEASIKCVINRWPRAEVVLLGESRFVGEHRLEFKDKALSIRRIPLRFSKNILANNHFLVLFCNALLLKVFHFRWLRNFLTERNPYLKLVLRADLFVDITGGDSFSDIYGMRRFILGFMKKLFPIIFGKEIILLPQTYGPFKKKLSKYMARYILRRASMIYSRDFESMKSIKFLLNKAIDDKKLRFVPDVAFVLDIRKPPNIDIGTFVEPKTDKSIVVGLNVSGLLYYGGYKNNMFEFEDGYKETIGNIIDFLMDKKDVIILLVPHVFPPAESAHVEVVENDVAACLDVHRIYADKYSDRIFMVRGSYDHAEIKYIIGLCDFFLGSRMHACIAALSQMVPAVGLAYSKKFLGVFDSIGVDDLVIDLRTKSKDGIISHLSKAFFEREATAQKLSQTVPKAQEEISEIFSPC